MKNNSKKAAVLLLVAIAFFFFIKYFYYINKSNQSVDNGIVEHICTTLNTRNLQITEYSNAESKVGGYMAVEVERTDPASFIFDTQGNQIEMTSFLKPETKDSFSKKYTDLVKGYPRTIIKTCGK